MALKPEHIESSRKLIRVEQGKGNTAIHHTWDQKLRDHFHLHCVIPAGYFSHDGDRWIHSKKKFLFPVKALSRVFRGKFMALMEEAFQHNDLIFPGKIADIGTKLSRYT